MGKFQTGNPGGPGRPRKAEKYAGAVAAAEQRIVDRLPELIDNLFTLAGGVVVEDTNPIDGSMSVYQKPPDRKANEYLIDRILGRPTQAIEAEIDADGSLHILVTYADPDRADPAETPSGPAPDPTGSTAL